MSAVSGKNYNPTQPEYIQIMRGVGYKINSGYPFSSAKEKLLCHNGLPSLEQVCLATEIRIWLLTGSAIGPKPSKPC